MTKTLWKVVGLLIIASISSAFVMQIATPPNVSVEIEEATLFLYGEDHALLRVIGTIENNGLQTVAISATRRRLVTGFILAGEDKKMHALPQQFSPGQAF
jgi:hypothetical protein